MENKKVNKFFVKSTNPQPPPWKGDLYYIYICKQDGAQDREFATNPSPSTIQRKDNKFIPP